MVSHGIYDQVSLGGPWWSQSYACVPFLCSSPSPFSFSPLFLFVLLDFPDWVPFHQTLKKVEMLDLKFLPAGIPFIHSPSVFILDKCHMGIPDFTALVFSYFCHGPSCFDSNYWCRGHHHISHLIPKESMQNLNSWPQMQRLQESKNIQRMQRKQKQKSAEIPARCSIFKCSSEVQPHRDSSPSGKAKKMPCNPSKEKKKEVKQGIREGLPHAQGEETLASSTVDSNVLTVWSHYMIFFSLFSSL